MSFFASRTKETLNLVRGDDTLTVVIRKMSARSLEKAAEARQAGAVARLRNMGGDLAKALREASATASEPEKPETAAPVPPPTLEERKRARNAAYDVATVLTASVESVAPLPDGVSLAQAIADFDQATEQEVFGKAMDLALPLDQEIVPKG